MPTRVRSFYIITTIAAETGSNLQARLSNTGAALPRPSSKGHQAIEDAERRNTRTAAINISRTLKRFLGHRQNSLVPGFSSIGPFDFLGLRPMIDSNSRRLSQAPASLPEHVGLAIGENSVAVFHSGNGENLIVTRRDARDERNAPRRGRLDD